MSPSVPLVSLMSPRDRGTCQVGTETSLELSREGSCRDADLELSLVGGTDEKHGWRECAEGTGRARSQAAMLQGTLAEQRNICLKKETEMRERKLGSAESWDPGDKSQLNREVRAVDLRMSIGLGKVETLAGLSQSCACGTRQTQAERSRGGVWGRGAEGPRQNRLLRGGVAWPGSAGQLTN